METEKQQPQQDESAQILYRLVFLQAKNVPQGSVDKLVKVSFRLGSACRETESVLVGRDKAADFTSDDIDAKIDFKKRLAYDKESQTFKSNTC